MLQLFSKLSSRTITFGDNIRNFVSVLDANGDKKKCTNLFDGLITKVDFSGRRIVITEQISDEHRELIVDFNDIVTISRMKDGRLRMWIKVKED